MCAYNTILCFKTKDAGYDYWWILDAEAPFVCVKLVTVHKRSSKIRRAPAVRVGSRQLVSKAGAVLPLNQG